MKYLVVIAALAVSGCAPMLQAGGLQPMDQWSKSGATQESFAKDKMECQYDTMKFAHRSGNDFIDAAERNRTFQMCMQTRGYTGGYSQ